LPTGTFAVISIMVGKCVNKYTTESGESDPNFEGTTLTYSPIEIATSICFIVGVIHVIKQNLFWTYTMKTIANSNLQLLMFAFRLGILSFLLSECLVSGFTTAAAIHVLTSQIKDLLGLKLPRIQGNFELIKVMIFNRFWALYVFCLF
jgi:solute carrier family 26, other